MSAKRKELMREPKTHRIRQKMPVETGLHEAKRLAEVINSLTANIAILDATGTIIAVNRAWRAFAQANSAPLQSNVCEGANYLDACDRASGADSEEAAAAATGIRTVMSGDLEEFTLEYPCHSPAEKRWFIVRVTRLSGDGLARAVVSHENISARKQIENELTRSRDNMRAILDNAPYIIWLKDTRGRYVKVNEVFANYVHLKTPAQLIGKTDFDLWPVELAEKFRADDAEVMAKCQKQRRIEEQSFDGTGMHWIETYKTAIVDDSGMVTGTSGFSRDITERKKIEDELMQTSAQLREMLVKYELLQEAERKAIAREVHDELGQLLSTLRLDISMIRTRFAKDNPALMELVKDATELVDRAIHGVRDVTEHLRPTMLGMGIYASLQWLCDNFTLRTGIACVLSPDPCVKLNEMSTTGLFRIVQESLTNVMRHADEVHHVNISMELSDGDLHISVKDDGKGFDLINTRLLTCYGILGMRERALALGGQLNIVSASGEGTTVSVRIPVNDREVKQ